MGYEMLMEKARKLRSVSARPMFGYQCFSVKGKFFVGFNKKNDHEVIVKLPKNQQLEAVKKNGIRPFSHGARAGWIEVDARSVTSNNAFGYIRKGYVHALDLSKQRPTGNRRA